MLHVHAMHVVHIAVVVVINPVGRFVPALVVEARLAWIPPHVRREIGVGVVHARIDDRHHDIRAAGRNRPSVGRPDFLQIPLLAEHGIVGDHGRRRRGSRAVQADGRAWCPHRAVIKSRLTTFARRAGDSAPYRRMDSQHTIRFHGQHRAESLIRLDAVAHPHAGRQFHVLPTDGEEVSFDRAADHHVAHGGTITLRAVLPFHEEFTFGVGRCGLELRAPQGQREQDYREQR